MILNETESDKRLVLNWNNLKNGVTHRFVFSAQYVEQITGQNVSFLGGNVTVEMGKNCIYFKPNQRKHNQITCHEILISNLAITHSIMRSLEDTSTKLKFITIPKYIGLPTCIFYYINCFIIFCAHPII